MFVFSVSVRSLSFSQVASVSTILPLTLEVDTGGPPSKGKSLLSYSLKEKAILFCLCLSNFIMYISMSMLAPFFPGEVTALLT